MKRLLLFWLLITELSTIAQDLPTVYSAGKECYSLKNYECYYDKMQLAFAIDSSQAVVRYHLGVASALTGKATEAFKRLRSALWLKADLPVLTNPDLLVLHSVPGWRDITRLSEKLNAVVIQSDTAAILTNRTLHLESVGFHQSYFYGASIRESKIVRFGNGKIKTTRTEGLPSFFGLTVEPSSNTIWVSASAVPQMRKYDSTLQSRVVGYNLDNLKQKKTYHAPGLVSRVLGDITHSKTGKLFVSDSQNNEVLTSDSNDTLTIFFKANEISSLQGICLSDDERYLFMVDYQTGIFRLDLKTKNLVQIANRTDAALQGIDGLKYYKGSVIAIQNGVYPMRVMRYTLNDLQDSIVSYEIIDWNHPAFHEPTNGTIVNDTLYYIGNSQWSGYDETNNPKPQTQLQDMVILKYDLSKMVRQK